jgi:hypothetical protein
MSLESLVPLREFCRSNKWPRLSQWHHWIYSNHPIARACVKRIGARYLVDVDKFKEYIEKASLTEKN